MQITIVLKVYTNRLNWKHKGFALASAKEGGKKIDMKGLTYN